VLNVGVSKSWKVLGFFCLPVLLGVVAAVAGECFVAMAAVAGSEEPRADEGVGVSGKEGDGRVHDSSCMASVEIFLLPLVGVRFCLVGVRVGVVGCASAVTAAAGASCFFLTRFGGAAAAADLAAPFICCSS